VKNEDVLQRVNKERNNIYATKSRWLAVMVTSCGGKAVIEGQIKGRIEMRGRRGKRRKQILGDLKET
jgi:hypothetical protein